MERFRHSQLGITHPIGALLAAALLSALITGILSPCAQGEDRKVITSYREVRSLTRAEASQYLPVRLTGIITFAHHPSSTMFMHHGEDDIFIERPPKSLESGPFPGDVVEVIGVTGPGLYSPVVRGLGEQPISIRVIGHEQLPDPRPIKASELAKPNIDCAWVSVDGQVHQVIIDDGNLVLECQTEGFSFNILLNGPLSPSSIPWGLAEAKIRVRGVAASNFNTTRQMTGRFIRIHSLADISSLSREPTQNYQSREAQVDELFQFAGPGPDDLVHVQGVSLSAITGRGVYLRTPHGSIWVQTAQPISANPGTLLDVEGWPRSGKIKPYLQARSTTISAWGVPPKPLLLPPSEALHLKYDAELISLEAELIDIMRDENSLVLELRNSPLVFRAVLAKELSAPLGNLEPGAKLRVNGIAQMSSAGPFGPLQEENNLLVRLRSADDVTIVSPAPYWTVRRVETAAGLTFTLLLVTYLPNRARRKRKQEAQHREIEAVLAERGRFAREIHDSLAQGLTSISLQLECVREEFRTNPDSALAHVENARTQVRNSLREARRTIWNLRPLALGEADLASVLHRFGDELTKTSGISCQQQIEGTPTTLPPEHEAALMRIGQEAMTNAVRHASPSEIRVGLRFGPDWVTLRVRDNGCGFDVAERAHSGFGLTSMRERVEALGGSLTIDSQTGEGTEVSATLPLPSKL